MYDEAGYEVATKTWRRHVKGLQMDSLEWQALFAVDELVKLMSHVCGHDYHPVEVDEPLF
jgi:hypothetical protein